MKKKNLYKILKNSKFSFFKKTPFNKESIMLKESDIIISNNHELAESFNNFVAMCNDAAQKINWTMSQEMDNTNLILNAIKNDKII